MRKGKIIIISGPSGSGKTTLYKKLLADPAFKGRLVRSISVTTRSKRPGEVHGRDYYFISRKMFAYKKAAGHFLECENVFDNSYGTPKKNVRDQIRSGKNVLLCIDVKGARTVVRNCPETARIFIKTASLAVLKTRLLKRASDDLKSVKLRLADARQELLEAKHYDAVVINDRIDTAYKRLSDLIQTLIRK